MCSDEFFLKHALVTCDSNSMNIQQSKALSHCNSGQYCLVCACACWNWAQV